MYLPQVMTSSMLNSTAQIVTNGLITPPETSSYNFNKNESLNAKLKQLPFKNRKIE